jgi:hypothetical protein
LPWDQSPDSFINLSNDIGKALGYVSDGLPTLSSQTISVGNKQGN